MNSLIEISIAGDLYFFENNLSDAKYLDLCTFTTAYLKKQKSTNHIFSIDEYVLNVYNKTGIKLIRYTIDKVISY